MNYWETLNKRGEPILGLAPMDGVTDVVFRYMVAKYGSEDLQNREDDGSSGGGVDVMFTEFVSVDALHYARNRKNWERVIKPLTRVRAVGKLNSYPYEVAQLFGKEPELFTEAAELVKKMGFDGIDVNMGCPVRKVSEKGAGAGLIATPELAKKIVRATRAGAGELPVSVKTRVGIFDAEEMEEWIEALMEVKPVVISLHGRTLKQLYSGKADWKLIGKAAEMVHNKGGIILGNGDVNSREEAWAKGQRYGVDGVLIGRASFGNPGIFLGNCEPDKQQRLEWMREQAEKYEEVFGTEHFQPVRKHLAWYCRGFPGASEMRQRLVLACSPREVEEIVEGQQDGE